MMYSVKGFDFICGSTFLLNKDDTENILQYFRCSVLTKIHE